MQISKSILLCVLAVCVLSQLTPQPFSWAQGGHDWLGMCATGLSQTPIDLPESPTNPLQPEFASIDNVQFSEIYVSSDSSPFSLFNSSGFFVYPATGTGSVLVNGDWFEGNVTQTHIHAPGAHVFDGVRYPAEIHIYLTPTSNETNYHHLEIALRVRQGNPNPFFDALINQESFNIDQLLNGILDDYYFYSGSSDVPTPDCVEPVAWVVLSTAVEASLDQIDYYSERYVDDYDFAQGHGAMRDLQPLNGRTIYRVTP